MSGVASLLGRVTQSYSHFTLEADIYRLDIAEGDGETLSALSLVGDRDILSSTQWYTLDAISALPLSGAEQKILQLL